MTFLSNLCCLQVKTTFYYFFFPSAASSEDVACCLATGATSILPPQCLGSWRAGPGDTLPHPIAGLIDIPMVEQKQTQCRRAMQDKQATCVPLWCFIPTSASLSRNYWPSGALNSRWLSNKNVVPCRNLYERSPSCRL